MLKEQYEELIENIHKANNSPVQRMSCFICYHCKTYKELPLRSHCYLHGYDLYDAMESVCFQFRPIRKD